MSGSRPLSSILLLCLLAAPVPAELVSVSADRANSDDRALLDRCVFSLQKALSAASVSLAPARDDEALAALLAEWSAQGDSGSRQLVEKINEQKRADEVIFCSCAGGTFRVWWLDRYATLKRAASLGVRAGFDDATLDSVVRRMVREELLPDDGERARARSRRALLSFLLPGGAQIAGGERLKGGLLIAGAAAGALSGVLCGVFLVDSRVEMSRASNMTEYDAYHARARGFGIGLIVSAGVYATLSVVSLLDTLGR